MVRRTIRCGIDANVENPECRTFEDKPIDIVGANRGIYIAAILTIARAYVAAGRPGTLPPMPSYEAWSNLVRSALVWLGCADPVETMDSSRDDDPVRQDRDRVFDAWRHELAIDKGYLPTELAELAQEQRSYDSTFARPKLRDALLDVAQKKSAVGQIEPRRLGRWLVANENTIAYGLKLRVDKSDWCRVRYSLKPTR